MKFSDMPTDFKISKVKRDASKKVIQESHVHPYYEIFYLVNGDCTFFINHDIYKLNKGDLVIVPEGELHKSTYPQRGFSEQYCLCFKDNNLEWLKEIIGEEIVNASLKMGVIESKEQDILSAAFIKIGLIELLLFIIRCQRFEQNVIKEIDVDNQLMQQIATYIYNNYNQKITLEHMADKFHISKSYLSKKFKSVTGFGFKEYLVNVRIKNACTLLLDTNKSITDIAFECGFNDSNYFGDAFRHVKGMSPNKYRRNKETI